jgi:hypothetical protein
MTVAMRSGPRDGAAVDPHYACGVEAALRLARARALEAVVVWRARARLERSP